MWKSEKGITLVALGITVMIMIILLGASMGTSNIIKTTQNQKIITNMVLIQNQIRIISDKADFYGSNSYYAGTPYAQSSEKTKFENILTQLEKTQGYIYILSKTDLANLGLNSISLSESEAYAVNYKTLEVIYSVGIESDGETLYRLSELGRRNTKQYIKLGGKE